MVFSVDLAPGADEHSVATALADLLRRSIEGHPRRARHLQSMRANVQVVALDTGDALTLRFDLGRVTIHVGALGLPAVTVAGPSELILGLPDRPLWELPGLIATGRLTVYGLAAHPRLVYRLARLVSRG